MSKEIFSPVATSTISFAIIGDIWDFIGLIAIIVGVIAFVGYRVFFKKK